MSAVALNRITIALGFIGIFVAGYLSLGHILNISLPCGINHGCDIVASHPSSYLTGDPTNGGIPVAYAGLLGYILLTVFGVVRSVIGLNKSKALIWVGFAASAFGAAYSGFLTYTAIYTIHATCIWCLASAITMVLTTITYAALLQTDLPDGDVAAKAKPSDLVFSSAMFLLAALALGGGVIQLKNSGDKLDPGAIPKIDGGQVDLVSKTAHIMGPETAPITIVEFADLLCPACKESFPHVYDLVRNGNGKIRLVFHHFPLVMKPDHRMSLPAATIAEMAADEGKFWDYISAIYTKTNEELQTPEAILQIAQAIGMNVDKVKKRLEDQNDPALQRATDDINMANTIKITSTPTIFIMVKGAPTVNVSPSQLDDKLKEEPYASLLKGAAPGGK